MTVTTPPRGPEIEQDRDLEQRVAELEALIEEARRRARRRRRIYAAAVLAAIAAGAAAAFDIGGSGVSAGSSAAEGSSGSLATQLDQGRWGPSHGPEGGNVFALAIDPSNPEIVYAGGWGNVFKSTNGGGSWSDVTTQPWTRVTALAIDPSRPEIVYAGTDGNARGIAKTVDGGNDRGIAKTVDGGRHWHMVNGGLFDVAGMFPRRGEGIISSLVVDARDPSIVYAITGVGLFRTTNGGARWSIIGPSQFRKRSCDTCNGRFVGYWLAAAIDPGRGTIYASWTGGGTTAELYKSSDGGDSWRRIAVHGPVNSFASLALAGDSSGTLFAAGDWQHRGIVTSTDGGRTWSPAGLATHHIGALNVDPGSRTLYVSTEREAFKTSDGGVTWQPAGQGVNLAWYGPVVSDPRASGTIYGATEAGIVKSLDGGQTWAASNTGLVSSLVQSLVFAPGSSKILYAGTSGSGVFKSTDRGRTWQPENSGLGKRQVLALAVSSRSQRTVYAGTRGAGVFRSTDAGHHWKPVNTGLRGETVEALWTDPRNSSTVFALSSGRNGRGGNFQIGGFSWRTITVPERVESFAIDSQTATTMFAGTRRGIYRSRDGGHSWQLVTTAVGAPGHGLWGAANRDKFRVIAITAHDPAIVYAGLQSSGIYKSSDGGDTWVASNTGLTDKHIMALAIDPQDARNLYVSTDGGVFRSTNGARSWQRFSRGLAANGVAALAIDPTGRTIYAGTDGYGVVASRTSK